jgi:RNA polymerase sigma-70 factor (ECF subfamily)
MTLPDARATNVVPLHRDGQLPDATLVLEAREGESWAKEALFRRHVRRVVALAYRLMPEEDPEDVAQDVFVKALSTLDKLANPAAFAGWVNSITVSLVKMRLRKKRWLRRLGLGSGEEVDPDTLVSSDAPEPVRLALGDLYRAARRLPEEERLALVLQRVEGLELDAIAEQLGLSVATVKRRIARAEAALSEVNDD